MIIQLNSMEAAFQKQTEYVLDCVQNRHLGGVQVMMVTSFQLKPKIHCMCTQIRQDGLCVYVWCMYAFSPFCVDASENNLLFYWKM